MTDLPGAHNAITDVPGIRVGHYERIGDGWATGTTVVLADKGATPAVDTRGGAPGTRETSALEPSTLIQRVHGVCLTGGSAYGLASADGVMRWLGERGIGFQVGAEPGQVVPLVPAAVLFDLPLSDWGNRPDAHFGYTACEAATDGAVVMGCVGAGTGATAGMLKGGIGTASTVVTDSCTVGVLLAMNACGEAVDPNSGLPWGASVEVADEFGIDAPNDGEVAAARERLGAKPEPLNTTIGVVATDAALSKAECQRLAIAAHDGLARAVRPAHTMYDGDTFFVLATGERELPTGAGHRYRTTETRPRELDRLCVAAADAVTRAVVRAMLAAVAVAGKPAYRDLYPSAFRSAPK
ncbi:P1 family peptidase [Allokutzneria sp. A3M-2-11 16]|uniref:P1 family peptidase n=1 Tax=Allokutzneria sp. A3M-2-11 16 TaxID=2962043 RepID=UPI0020B67CC4|nr:P1 family peptidase [Allokutzneria sp. A3M-2-11 16]MCP3798302.1 P1 family peptidase [Allokutzneria sp. A3M-2-11 16]